MDVGAGSRKELGFPELVGILYGRRWLLLAGLLLGGAAGGAAALLIPPTFSAQALLLLEAQQARPSQGGAPPALDGSLVDSQPQILASRALARAVIDRLGLAGDPELAGGEGSFPHLPGSLRPGGSPDLVGRFLERLQVRRDGKSYVIALTYRSGDPEKAARVVNTVAELYRADQQARRQEQGSRARSLLAEQSELARAQLARSEARLQAFRARTGPDREGGIAVDSGELAALNNQLVLAAAERTAREARLAQLRTSLQSGSPGSAEGASVVLQNLGALKAELLRREAELSGQYGARHPRLQDLRKEKAQLDARIAEEWQGQLRALAHEVEAARAREQALARSLEALKGRALREDEAVRGEAALVREVELDRRLYEALIERASAEADLGGAPAVEARVISAAVPPTVPTFPRPKLLSSLGATVGLGLALFLVYLLESRDHGFAGPDEIQEELGLPTLALVPELPQAQGGPAPQDHALEKPRSRYAEALRDILAGLSLEPHAGGPGQVVLLTSVLPDEGKSTLALSLGRLGVAEGLRVLVIDADLRRPSLHRLAGLKPGPGIIELLRGEVAPEEVIHADPRSGLRILASSGRLSQPTRLLASDRLGRVLQLVRARFDLVLVDTAPLTAVADPRLLAPLADRTLLLIRHASTRRALAASSLASLRATGAVLAGAVLSRTDLRRYQEAARYRLGAAHAALARYYAD